jgi:hypothetical protein
VPIAAALHARELANADGLAGAGHAVDLGLARAPNLAVQEDLVHDEASARRRDVAVVDGDADVDDAAMPLVVVRIIFQLPSNGDASAGAAKARMAAAPVGAKARMRVPIMGVLIVSWEFS